MFLIKSGHAWVISWVLRASHFLRESALKNVILFFFTILKSNFIIYNIPFYNTTYIKKFYYFIFLLKYYFLIFFIISFPTSLFFSTPKVTFSWASELFLFFSRLAFSNSHIFLGYATLFFFPTVMLIPVAFTWPLSFLSNSNVFSNGDTEIQRTKREKGTEVPVNGERNFRGKKNDIKY